jgi:hypothetical protein
MPPQPHRPQALPDSDPIIIASHAHQTTLLNGAYHYSPYSDTHAARPFPALRFNCR